MGFWTTAKIEVLRGWATAGGSYTDAAEELGCSRCAVAGKAHREGIRFSAHPKAFNERISKAKRAYWRNWRLARSETQRAPDATPGR